MPRKKKPTEGLDSRGQDGEEEEEEKRNPANAKKKRSFVDAFIVISDSDGEESKEESGLQKKRTKQQLDRTKFAAKRKIAQMEHKIKADPPLEMPLKCDQAYGAKNRELLKLDVLIASLSVPCFGSWCCEKGVRCAPENPWETRTAL